MGSSLCPAESVKNLDVWFNSDFSLSKHVQNVCKSCFVQLRDFRHVRRFLTHDASVFVANALFSSRLDYCNSLFRNLSKFNIRNLQCIQNSTTRIISNTSRYTSITPVSKNCFGFLLNIAQSLKQPPLFTSFFTLVFQVFCYYISLPTADLTVPGTIRVVVISLSFQSSNPLFINPSKSLVIILHLMAPLFGMLFLMRFVHPPPSLFQKVPQKCFWFCCALDFPLNKGDKVL